MVIAEVHDPDTEEKLILPYSPRNILKKAVEKFGNKSLTTQILFSFIL